MPSPSSPDSDEPIFHLALPDEWADAFQTGTYTMSTRGMTLGEVGFIHASTRHQIEGVATRFYADLDQLVLLTIDPQKVTPEIVWEPPAPGIDELFPHVYGALAIEAVVATDFWIRAEGEPWNLATLA